MAIELNTPVVEAVQGMLTDDLPAVLDGISADLRPPVNVYDFIPPISLIVDHPTLGIGDGSSNFEDDQGFSMTGKHSLMIVAWLANPDQQQLVAELRSYAKAIVRTLRADQTLRGSAWGMGFQRIVPGPTLTDDPEKPREYSSWVGVDFWAKREEE